MSTMDLHWSQELRDLKTSCKDNYVKLILNTGRSDDSSFSKFLDSLGAKLYVSLVKRVKISGVKNAPLAACTRR